MTIVYTKDNCVQCDATKRMMDKLGGTLLYRRYHR